MSRLAIRLENLEVRYNESDKPSLSIDKLEINEGETVLVLGKSGSGKSTLGKTISGVIPHIEKAEVRGIVNVCGIDPRSVSIEKIIRNVAYLSQSPYDQIVFTKVIDELVITLENIKNEFDEKDVDKYLNILGIGHLKYRHVKELSGGELQKLAIACILALDPKILVLDEPLAHLDPQSCREFINIVKVLKELGKTLIIIEHRFRELTDIIERRLIDKILLLKDCKPIAILDSYNILNNLELLEHLGIILPLNCKLSLMLRRNLRSLVDYSIIDDVVHMISIDSGYEVRDRYYSNSSLLLSISNLYAGYFSKIGKEGRKIFWILRNINMNVKRGEIVGVVGPNGAGKSTLLRSILRMVPHVKGSITLLGQNVKKIGNLRRRVGYVPQNPDLILIYDTVYKEIYERARISTRSALEARRRTFTIVESLDLNDVLNRSPHSLSRGQRFRVAIAAVLALDPVLLLLDEPTVGQDEECIERLGEILREFVKNDRGVIVVTHDLGFVADYVDRIYVLNSGSIVAEGDPIDIMRSGIMDSIGIPVPEYVKVLSRHSVRVRPREVLEMLGRRLVYAS